MSAGSGFWRLRLGGSRRVLAVCCSVLVLGFCVAGRCATPSGPNPEPNAVSSADPVPDAPVPQFGDDSEPVGKVTVKLRDTPLNILKDQQAIWTSPGRVREHNLTYLLPLGLATALAITTDHQVMSSARLQNPSLNSHAVTASNGLLGAFVVAPVALYGLGHFRHDDHATEAGLLGGEAMVDSLVVDEAMKAVMMRERPTVDGAKGKFFQSSVGIDSSFPSTHSFIAWSSAAVLASEYDNRLAKLTIYGLATGVSLTRVLGREHFPSDVVIASGLGWLVGRYVFHRHGHWIQDNY